MVIYLFILFSISFAKSDALIGATIGKNITAIALKIIARISDA
jgi:hypothetical protein